MVTLHGTGVNPLKTDDTSDSISCHSDLLEVAAHFNNMKQVGHCSE